MQEKQIVISLLGSAGGVAKSILSLLNKAVMDQHDPIHDSLMNSKIHLIDLKQQSSEYFRTLFPQIYKYLSLHQFDLNDTSELIHHLKTSNTEIVIDVSWADTVQMLECCNQLGIKYVNSALENTYIDEHEEQFIGFPLIERIRYFEKHKDKLTQTTAIVCSGMNPGVVQWMAIEMMKQYPNEIPLGCYIVEQDNSFFKDKREAKDNVIYTTWSPECFLDEAILCYPMFMKQETPLFLYEDVYDVEFKVTLGNQEFFGCLMPHEEVYTLGKYYNMETGFIYKVNEHTTRIIRKNLDDVDVLWDFEMKVLDPLESPLIGEDLVGVLLVYPDKERYMYNSMNNETIFSEFKTNATYFQVACGIYAAFSVLLLDQIPIGIYYVDDLLLKTTNRYGEFLTYHMKDFVIGENLKTDGRLLDRMREFLDQ